MGDGSWVAGGRINFYHRPPVGVRIPRHAIISSFQAFCSIATVYPSLFKSFGEHEKSGTMGLLEGGDVP